MSDPRTLAIALAWRLSNLPEPAMRRAVFAETCVNTEPELLAAVLHALIDGARTTPGPPFTAALETLALALDESNAALTYEARAALYAAARSAGHDEVARLLFSAARHASEPAPPDPEQALYASTQTPPARLAPPPSGGAARTAPDTPSGLRDKPLTLGARKALARGQRRELLDRLVRDPDAEVIRVILGNPRLTERDVLTIAARRPVRVDVLRAVFESRWLARYHVKRALVMNPYLPSDLAVRLVATLAAPDLRLVATDSNLAPAVREQAQALLAIIEGAGEREAQPAQQAPEATDDAAPGQPGPGEGRGEALDEKPREAPGEPDGAPPAR